MDFEKYISNLNSPEYQRYLKYYESFQNDRKKCLKNKKCKDKYIETPKQLKVEKGGKEKIVKKPTYIFLIPKINELKNNIEIIQNKIRDYRFIVETDTSKKISEEFNKLKDEYLKTKNELDEVNKYLLDYKTENKERLQEINSSIFEQENIKRQLYFEIENETNETEKRKKIEEYLNNKVVIKLKVEKEKLKKKDINFIITELPIFNTKKITKKKPPKKSNDEEPPKKSNDEEQPKKSNEEQPKKSNDEEPVEKDKKKKKRCPKGQRRNKKTGECEGKK
mgnify:CR=1 FL=1